jgi:hypothetical protein
MLEIIQLPSLKSLSIRPMTCNVIPQVQMRSDQKYKLFRRLKVKKICKVSSMVIHTETPQNAAMRQYAVGSVSISQLIGLLSLRNYDNNI